MDTESDHADVVSPRQLPRCGRLRNFAWGLAAFAVLVYAAIWERLFYPLDRATSAAAVLFPPAPRVSIPRGAVQFPLAVAGLMLSGPFWLAALVAGRRPRWWWGPLLGVWVGFTVGWFWTVFGGTRVAPLVSLYWVAGGLIGGVLAAVRRRWEC